VSAFSVVPTPRWATDVDELRDFLIERELSSNTPDETVVDRFDAVLKQALEILTFAPHTCRRSEAATSLRELVVGFGHSGCIVLFGIVGDQVVLLRARHQHARDYR
jgi:hypothetical protein